MGTVSNSLLSAISTLTGTPTTPANASSTSTSSSSSSSANTTGIFTGTSAYSSDFQNVINREVAIASLPMNLLNGQVTALTSQSTELTKLDTDFTALQTAIAGISTAMGGASYDSTSTDPSAVTATLGDGATEGVYTVTVDSAGAAASSISTNAWSQTSTLGPGQTATYDLVIGNQQNTVTTSDNSAQGVAAAINAQYGSQVNAVAVNVGNNKWSISLQSNSLGPGALDILQPPPSGLQTQNTYAISQTTGAWDSAGGSYNLLVNGASYALSPASGSAADVAAAINTVAAANNLGVNATVAGSGIQLVGTTAGAMTLDISDDNSSSLQTQAPATSETTATWNSAATAAGTQTQYTLDVGAQTYNFTAGDNSAQTVAAAINALSTANSLNVAATVVDLGTGGNHDYRIALEDTSATGTTLDLQQATSLQTQSATGYAISQTTKTWPAASDTYSLVVNGTSYSLSPASDSAQDVATAINAAAAANSLSVTATVVNLGTTADPDDRIQLAGTQPGAMTLAIDNGSSVNLQTAQTPATSLTGATWNSTADAAGTRSEYSLVVGSHTYNFLAADNSAQSVAAAINTQFGSLVNASVVNLGTSGTPDYRIALQDKTGANPTLDIQKTAAATSYQTQQTTGALAQYSLDGAAPVTSTTASVNVANGVTLNLLGTNANASGVPQPVSVTVTQSTDAISTALQAFADAYNTCVDEITSQRGQQAGPLQGTSILSELSQTLSGLATYGSGSSTVNSLESMGFDLDTNNDGHLSFTPLTFMGACFGSQSSVDAFLGAAPSTDAPNGSGFLAFATNALTNLEDSTSGLIKTGESDLTTQITNINTQIATKQAQVDQLQTTLTSQMASADAAIATMEQQYSYLSSMLQAQQTANQQYTGE